MSDVTARLALPMIVPGQAQKELTHNEALAILDVSVQPNVVELGRNAPPAAPTDGACWIVGDSPTGAWAGHGGSLVAWTAGGWRFVTPTPGFRVWVTGLQAEARYVGGAWKRVAPAAAIPDPTGGATPDAEARAAIVAILAALRHHDLIGTP